VVAYTIGMVTHTTTQDDDGKVIDATGLFGASAQQSSPTDRPDEPEVYAPRQVASQLLVPGGELLSGNPREADDYFTNLVERRRNGTGDAADPNGPKRSASSADHDGLDLFFERAAMQAPSSGSLAPTAPGSASLDESAAPARSARNLRLTAPRIAASVAASLVGITLVVAAVVHSHGMPTRAHASHGFQASVSFLASFAAQTHNTASRIGVVSVHRPPRAHVNRRPKWPTEHHHTRATAGPRRTVIASTVPDRSTATSSSVSQPSTGSTTRSTSSATAPTGSTQPVSIHKTPTATTRRPAFGQVGTLGPGHSPDS
jgi:hypothetical protein